MVLRLLVKIAGDGLKIDTPLCRKSNVSKLIFLNLGVRRLLVGLTILRTRRLMTRLTLSPVVLMVLLQLVPLTIRVRFTLNYRVQVVEDENPPAKNLTLLGRGTVLHDGRPLTVSPTLVLLNLGSTLLSERNRVLRVPGVDLV